MSPEYRVSLAIPYVFVVTAENPETAEQKAVKALVQNVGEELAREAVVTEIEEAPQPARTIYETRGTDTK